MKLCLSIAPSSMAEAMRMLKLVKRSADLVELRIDRISDLNLKKIFKKPRPRLIITNRRADEGGMFTGTKAEQLSMLTQAARLGAEYVDIEMSWGYDAVKELISSSRKTSVIVSHHDFSETPGHLSTLYRKMQATRPDIIKIAAMATAIEDNKKMLDLYGIAKKSRQPTIALCMGEYGEISRILSGNYGGFLTFGSLSNNETTAPGQQTIDYLKNVFRIHTLNSHTKVFGLVGNPVSQSKGIIVHNRIFARTSVNAVYVNFLVDNLKSFLSTFHEMFSGLSITMPFKQEIIPLLDSVSEAARATGVVNTVIKHKNKLYGDNTDLPAIISLLKRRKNPKNKNVAILGTGATAKTMAFAARANGARTTIIGRTLSKAQATARQFDCDAATYEHIRDVRCDILMNGTSVGMSAKERQHPGQLIPRSFLRSGMVVFDAVYNPPMTRLLLDAKAAGCDIISGVELFNHQARLQSKLFIESIS